MIKVDVYLKCRNGRLWCGFVFLISDERAKESEHINLKVAGQDGSVVQFTTPLANLMKAYCDRQGWWFVPWPTCRSVLG
ncbi:hypothetical protein AMELA_G00084490 [Ameiurus melas]|uniref:Uncharacterized protein n=1 Tax=Ameiurus melas TaxID=219545 RepID=A0A7J6AUC3_AMEME|nr:hypothetical protein AMELA_G00084490 [Ameiurus melas]